MKMNLLIIFVLILKALSGSAYCQSTQPCISMETEMGEVIVVLFMDKAPVTCSNFMFYVNRIGKDGGTFYRTVTLSNQPENKTKIEVIQGGFNLSDLDSSEIHPIMLERTSLTGILHTDGTLSMARDDPDSGTSEFFICIGDQTSLDFGGARNPDGQGFAAFGRVIEGMDVVRRIQIAPSSNQSLIPPVKILKFEIDTINYPDY